MYFVYDSNNNK